MDEESLFQAGPNGPVYRVSIHPHERADGRGVSLWLNSVVFEELATGRVLTAPIDRERELGDLAERDLAALLRDAADRSSA